MMNDLYEWHARGAAHCPVCAYLDGKRLSKEQWEALLQPGFHRGCDCELVLAAATDEVSAVEWLDQPAAHRAGRLRASAPRAAGLHAERTRILAR